MGDAQRDAHPTVLRALELLVQTLARHSTISMKDKRDP
jgi:hypothetical protein